MSADIPSFRSLAYDSSPPAIPSPDIRILNVGTHEMRPQEAHSHKGTRTKRLACGLLPSLLGRGWGRGFCMRPYTEEKA